MAESGSGGPSCPVFSERQPGQQQGSRSDKLLPFQIPFTAILFLFLPPALLGLESRELLLPFASEGSQAQRGAVPCLRLHG